MNLADHPAEDILLCRSCVLFSASMGYCGLNPVSRQAWETTGRQNNERSGSAFFSDLLKQVTDRTQGAEQESAASSLNARLFMILSQKMMIQINESLLGILTEDGGDQPLCDPFIDRFEQMLYNQAAGREIPSEIRQAPSGNGCQEIETNGAVTATASLPLSFVSPGLGESLPAPASMFGKDIKSSRVMSCN